MSLRLFALLCVASFVPGAVFAAGSSPQGAANEAAEHLAAADLLPATTVLYAEIPDPGRLIDLAMDHPIHERLRQVDDFRKAIETPQYRQFLLGVKMFEGAVEMRWRPALNLLTKGGVYVAVDGETKGAALLVKSGDAEKLAAVKEAILTIVRADAQQKGRSDPIKTGDYHGVTAHAVGKAKLAIFGPWLLVTNKDELGKAVLDRYLDAGDGATGEALWQNAQFQMARETQPDADAGWAYVDVKALREMGVGKNVSEGPKGNPLAELLLGGVIAAVNQAPFAAAALEADPQRIALSVAIPFDPASVDESRTYYFGPDAKSAAPPLLSVKESVFTLSTYRDLADYWASAPDLFNENIDAKFAQANSGLSTLFSGRDFGDEVLGSVRPEMQLVVARQSLPHPELPAPTIKLPAFAAVFRFKDANKMRRPMKVSLQSLIGFLNVVGAMKGQPQFESSTSQQGDVEIISGKYLPPADEEDAERGLINYNFWPTAAFVGNVFIVSSTRPLAEELAEAALRAQRGEPAEEEAQTNLHARFDSRVLQAILNDNREQILAQHMLEKGHSREEAEKEIGALFEALSWLRGSAFRLAHDQQTLRLEWNVTLVADPKTDAE